MWDNILKVGILAILLVVVTISGCTDNAENTYTVGNSTFNLSNQWAPTNINGSSISRTKLEQNGVSILISQYNDLSNYNQDYSNSKQNYQTNSTEITGISITKINTGINKYLYYFQKNGKSFSVNIEGATEPNAIKYINSIISTLN